MIIGGSSRCMQKIIMRQNILGKFPIAPDQESVGRYPDRIERKNIVHLGIFIVHIESKVHIPPRQSPTTFKTIARGGNLNAGQTQISRRRFQSGNCFCLRALTVMPLVDYRKPLFQPSAARLRHWFRHNTQNNLKNTAQIKVSAPTVASPAPAQPETSPPPSRNRQSERWVPQDPC